MSLLRFLMFNWFVRSYLNSDFWFLRLNRRIKCFTLEMWYTLSIFFPILAMSLFLKMELRDKISTDFEPTDLVGLIAMALTLTALFNKDFVNGQSVVHRKIGYKVLDMATKQTASKVQCFVRNLTGIIWPVEVIFILISPTRRLGDVLARTILVEVPATDPETILREIKEVKFDQDAKIALVISLIFLVAYSVFLCSPGLWW